jgi:hypothetical protein
VKFTRVNTSRWVLKIQAYQTRNGNKFIDPLTSSGQHRLIHTVLLKHLLNLPDELSAFDNVKVKLVEASGGGQFGTREFAERMEVDAVDGSQQEIANEGDCHSR